LSSEAHAGLRVIRNVPRFGRAAEYGVDVAMSRASLGVQPPAFFGVGLDADVVRLFQSAERTRQLALSGAAVDVEQA